MTIKKFHIFKPGTHTAMGGQTLGFSARDLQEAAAAFSESVRPAPLVLGHPQHDSPAMGWVKQLTFQDGKLYATADFGEELVNHVKAKRYPKVSAAFLSKDDARNPTPGRWYLRHVGFLGAIPPALKDLEPVTFAEFSWDGQEARTSPASLCEAVFAEVVQAGNDVHKKRHVMHAMANELMKRDPSLSYEAAAHSAHRHIQNFKASRAPDSGMNPERIAFHEAILDYQAGTPGMSYAAAAHHIISQRKTGK